MRSRYTNFVNKQQQEIYERKISEMQKGFAVLYEKLLIYTLHTEFGFGEKRLKQMFEAVTAQVDNMRDDPIFWNRVDRDVIENLHFDYPKCDCEFMEKVFYKPPEISAEEKRKAFSDMQKMKEFLSQEGKR